MRRLRTFWRYLAWAAGVHALIYVAYVTDVFLSHGGVDWFTLLVYRVYGSGGAHFMAEPGANDWAGFGALILYAPLIGMALMTFLIAVAAAFATKPRAA